MTAGDKAALPWGGAALGGECSALTAWFNSWAQKEGKLTYSRRARHCLGRMGSLVAYQKLGGKADVVSRKTAINCSVMMRSNVQRIWNGWDWKEP